MATITAPSIQFTKLSKYIGTEVTGVDLTKPIDEATRRKLHEALVESIALVIRNQKFTPQQFLDAAKLFGDPMDRYFMDHSIPGVPYVHEVSSRHRSKDGTVKKVGPRWHSDHTNQEYPPKFTTLYAVEIPQAGGGTSVVNTRAGYEALPEDMKRRIRDFKTVNVMVGSAVVKNENTDTKLRQETVKPQPVIQPLVRTNPDSGGQALYFHPSKTENIVGMSPHDSQELLDDLLERAIQPQFIYSHQWRLGDMLIWDNRSSMHKANYDYNPEDTSQHRLMYRMLIRGERPY